LAPFSTDFRPAQLFHDVIVEFYPARPGQVKDIVLVHFS